MGFINQQTSHSWAKNLVQRVVFRAAVAEFAEHWLRHPCAYHSALPGGHRPPGAMIRWATRKDRSMGGFQLVMGDTQELEFLFLIVENPKIWMMNWR